MSESDLELYDIVGKMLREIREDKGYSLEAGADYLGIAPKSLQRYECGERKIRIGTIKSLCEFYKINYDTFINEAKLRFGRSSNEPTYYTCPECGFSYLTDSSSDIEEHIKEHSSWQKATDKFGTLYFNHSMNEKIKTKNRNTAKDLSRPLDERYLAQLEVLRCLFSRSVESSECNLRHVPFEEYVAMLLNTKSYRKKLDKELCEKLIGVFGMLPGINEKESIYHIPETGEADSSNKNKLPKIMDYYNQLNDIGKHEATKRVEELTNLPQYINEPDRFMVNAAHAIPGASEEDKQYDEDIMDDEDF